MVRYEIPRLYETESVPFQEKIIHAHYFLPGTNWEWYVAEMDEKGQTAFGYVVSGLDPTFSEWGYIDMNELLGVRTGMRIVNKDSGKKMADLEVRVQRDRQWRARTVKEIEAIK